MSDRKLTMLGIVAVLMVIWAVAQSRIANEPKGKPEVPSYLIQGVDPADIASIVLTSNDDTITLKRRQDRFVIADKDDYPALAGEITKLLTSCFDIRNAELYTEDKANHKDLGVAEEDARTVVKFLGPDSSLITGVVIGKASEQGRGTYVRLVASDKVYVASQVPRVKSQAMDYMDPKLVSMERGDIESVTVISPNETYTLKGGNGGIRLENLPDGKKLKAGEYGHAFSALTNLRFDDVSGKSSAQEDLNFERKFICRMKDSTVYTVAIAQKNDKTYMTCDADFTDKVPVTKEKTVESEEELKKKEAKLLARDKAAEFSSKHSGWVYEISDYNAEDMTKELSELLEDQSEPESQTADDSNSAD
ncbi:MAG: DUF4340 domain-containing protein [Planctomycetota bacterium]